MDIYKKHIFRRLLSVPKKITIKKIHTANYLETAGEFTLGVCQLSSPRVSDLKINPTNTGLDQVQEQFNILIIKKAWNCHSPHPLQPASGYKPPRWLWHAAWTIYCYL